MSELAGVRSDAETTVRAFLAALERFDIDAAGRLVDPTRGSGA